MPIRTVHSLCLALSFCLFACGGVESKRERTAPARRLGQEHTGTQGQNPPDLQRHRHPGRFRRPGMMNPSSSALNRPTSIFLPHRNEGGTFMLGFAKTSIASAQRLDRSPDDLIKGSPTQQAQLSIVMSGGTEPKGSH